MLARPSPALAACARLLAGCLALACSAPGGAPERPAGAALARGEQIFLGSCAGYCHSPATGGRGDAPDLFDCVWVYGSTDAAILRSIAQGVPDSDMPGFAEALSPADLRLLVAWLRAESRCSPGSP